MTKPLAETAREADLVQALTGLSKTSHWEPVGEVVLDFPAHHPQGMAFANGLTFLSSVKILDSPRPAPDPALRTTGRGTGHVFLLNAEGGLIYDVQLGEGSLYHPGGIDFDGADIWVPVSEYRARSRSIIYTISPSTRQPRERFRVNDHIGWVLRDPALDLVFGGSWGSREFYTWTPDGRQVDKWTNPGHFVDYQDAQCVAPGILFCTGISVLPATNGESFELGGIGVIDLPNRRVIHDTPVTVFTAAGHVITRNPIAVGLDEKGLLLHAAPDDSNEPGQSRILSYRAV